MAAAAPVSPPAAAEPATLDVDLGSDAQFDRSSDAGGGGGGGTGSTRSSSAISLRDPASFQFSEYLASSFYSYKEGALDKAVADICQLIIKPDVDGTLLGSWLLLEVDHWDAETEKVVVLTEHSLFSVRYDFVPMKPYRFKKVSLKEIDTVKFGNFVYPKMSLATNKRTGGGLRLCWNRGVVPSFTQRWRTADDAVPWMTFTHHHFLSLPKESENLRYNCDDCCKRLVPAIQYAQEMAVAAAAGAPEQAPGETGGNQPPARARAKLAVMESALEQNVYLGLHSLIHNQSFMGISKERGGFSF